MFALCAKYWNFSLIRFRMNMFTRPMKCFVKRTVFHALIRLWFLASWLACVKIQNRIQKMWLLLNWEKQRWAKANWNKNNFIISILHFIGESPARRWPDGPLFGGVSYTLRLQYGRVENIPELQTSRSDESEFKRWRRW